MRVGGHLRGFCAAARPGAAEGVERMIVELGHFALILALMVGAGADGAAALGAHVRSPALMAVAAPAAVVQFALVAFAFGV